MVGEILFKMAGSIGDTLMEASFYLLLGLLAAGIVKAWVNEQKILRSIGQPDFSSVVKASLVGIPLPLCSCSVVPMAMSIREKGASKGATVSFLISTPETGVDSIAMTYAMMDPLMTVFRPFAAMTTALTAGAIENTVSGKSSTLPNPLPDSSIQKDCSGGYCSCSEPASDKKSQFFFQKFRNALRYAFVDLLGDIVIYLIVGLVLSGMIAAMIPDDWFSQHPEWLIMLLMLVIGIPVYVCASASTPVAAALILKGISPGAALVFLLVGPATNLATIAIVYKMMGMRSAIIYLLTIMSLAVGLGVLLNVLYGIFQIQPSAMAVVENEFFSEPVQFIFALVLCILVVYHVIRKFCAKYLMNKS